MVEKDSQDSIIILVLTILLAISTIINIICYIDKTKARTATLVPAATQVNK